MSLNNIDEAKERLKELLEKFEKSFQFFEKYTEYEKTNPIQFKELMIKLELIVSEIGSLDWINDAPKKEKKQFQSKLFPI